MFDLNSIQKALKEANLDGWLLYDFRGLNVLAQRVIGMPANKSFSRRWFYMIPKEGKPIRLMHRIETDSLQGLPGQSIVYLHRNELEEGVKTALQGCKKIAMEYVPRNANPYISRVDAGTIELVRSFGVEVVSSGDLIQLFEACWTQEQWEMHLEAARHTRSAYDVAFQFIAEQIRAHGYVREMAVQDRIMKHFDDHGLTTNHPPIVGRGAHSGNPHYTPEESTNWEIRLHDFVLIDLWAKLKKENAVYSDLTRVAYVCQKEDTLPDPYVKIFNIVAAARDAGIDCVRQAFATQQKLQGWQVDQAVRNVIEKAGYGPFFIHRTGHSIGQETHGNGANMDGLETLEERHVLPRTCFSIEPGIYLPEFGVRSEVNVYVDAESKVHVTGGDPQTEIHRIVV